MNFHEVRDQPDAKAMMLASSKWNERIDTLSHQMRTRYAHFVLQGIIYSLNRLSRTRKKVEAQEFASWPSR